MAMCPRCLYHLREAHQRLVREPETLRAQERRWGRPISLDLPIIHFLEVLVRLGPARLKQGLVRNLNGLKFVPYYGCTLFRPPALRQGTYYQGELGNVLAMLGGEPLTRALTHRCCGSFLSAARADVVTPLVNEILASAVAVGAECLVTSCAMCQLNLEIRCTCGAPVAGLSLFRNFGPGPGGGGLRGLVHPPPGGPPAPPRGQEPDRLESYPRQITLHTPARPAAPAHAMRVPEANGR